MQSAERLLCAWLPDQLGGVRVSTEIPSNLADVLPIVRVRRTGGSRKASLTTASVDFDYFAATSTAVSELAEQVDDVLNYQLPVMVNGHVLGFRGTYAGPQFRSYDNTFLAHMGAAYGLMVHRAALVG